MQVICLEDDAFHILIEQVYERLKNKHDIKQEKWIDGKEAMKKLRITSRATLQSLRDNGSIEFTKLSEKHILYNSFSIDSYLEKHKRSTF